MVNERNHGIDLLRLVLMFMVCMLHTLGQGGILSSCEPGSLNHRAYWFLETASYCAVDAFALISGYMASDRPRKYGRLIEMWFQAFFYSFVLTFILTVAGVNGVWEKSDIIKCVFPMMFGKFWYFTAYFALFFAIPVLNGFIFKIGEETAKKALIILVSLFSVAGVVTDPFKTQWGYSALWLIVLYCIGSLAKRVKLFETRKSMTLIAWWVCCIGVSWAIIAFAGIGRQINYLSPTILLSGIIMVILFSRINVRGGLSSYRSCRLWPLAYTCFRTIRSYGIQS